MRRNQLLTNKEQVYLFFVVVFVGVPVLGVVVTHYFPGEKAFKAGIVMAVLPSLFSLVMWLSWSEDYSDLEEETSEKIKEIERQNKGYKAIVDKFVDVETEDVEFEERESEYTGIFHTPTVDMIPEEDEEEEKSQNAEVKEAYERS